MMEVLGCMTLHDSHQTGTSRLGCHSHSLLVHREDRTYICGGTAMNSRPRLHRLYHTQASGPRASCLTILHLSFHLYTTGTKIAPTS